MKKDKINKILEDYWNSFVKLYGKSKNKESPTCKPGFKYVQKWATTNLVNYFCSSSFYFNSVNKYFLKLI